jgi:uncharacterized protein YigE (DUF2233 family)
MFLKTDNFSKVTPENTNWAIQNGPALLQDGENLCNPKSTSKNIRSGIGYNEKNELIVITTEQEVTPYEFAEMFKAQGYKNAIFLDGWPKKADNDPVGYKFQVTENDGSTKIEEDKMQPQRPLLQFFHAKITEKEICSE